MSQLNPRDRRLAAELKNMQRLAEHSSFFSFKADHEHFPEEYVVTYSCLSLVSQPPQDVEALTHDIEMRRTRPWVKESRQATVYLPADYPQQPPQIRFLTPIFHPNLSYVTEEKLEELLAEQFGGLRNLRMVLARSQTAREQARLLLATHICLDGIRSPKEGGAYEASLTLYDICLELGHLIMYQRYNLDDPLDPVAKQWTAWAEKQEGFLPVDPRGFQDRLPA